MMSILNNSLRHGELRFPKNTGSPAGPVKVYYLTEEERAEIIRKYGPPGKNKGKPSPILKMYYERLERKGIAE